MSRPFQTPRRWLLLILAVGAALRFFGQNWDQGAGQHPDERHILMCEHRLGWPSSLAEYLDESRSPLNPRNRDAHFYAYGTLPTTILRAVLELGSATNSGNDSRFGRALAALADLASIALVFALAKTLYRDRRIALLAAAFYALAVLPIQHAHFFVVDPFANAFVMLTLVLLAQAWRRGSGAFYAAAGIAFGLAVSCKIAVVTLGLPVGLVALLPAAGAARRRWWSALLIAAGRMLCFLVAAAITIRFALPDAFAGPGLWPLAPRWLKNMSEVISMSTGEFDVPFTRQFYGRTPLLWPWWNMVVWGLGAALGLTAWLGWLAAGWRMVWRRAWMHLIPVAWIATVFFHQGFVYQCTLRYFLPIYGCLAILAAWLLVRMVDLAPQRARSSRLLRQAAVAAVLLFTAAWALAFVSIYRQPHTRVEASRWIYDHIPKGTVLGCEHWDDYLPLPLDGIRGPQEYQQIELPHYVADDVEKRGQLLAKLNAASYIILASQKLRDSIPRMPHRYPFTISYYSGLEDGTLGFDKVAEFTRPMNFLGYRISTRSAEEAFSVYDHPPVVIYKKAARFDPEKLVVRFNAIPLDGVTDTRTPVKPQPRAARTDNKTKPLAEESAILLPPERWARDQARGTWSESFNRNSFAARHPVLIWVLHLFLLQGIGWAFLFPFLRGLPDRGAALARPLAILIPLWLHWLLASGGLVLFRRPEYWGILGGFALVGVFCARRFQADWRAWWTANKREAIRNEAIFWGAFFFFVAVRMGNPDLWHPAWGGEKPMEMTFLYGVMRSEEFPPYNPWFAGGFVNYYYFGFVLCGGLIKALGVLPEVGFNLCLATFFALTASAAFCAGRALCIRSRDTRPAGDWLDEALPTYEERERRKQARCAEQSAPVGDPTWPAWAATAFVAFIGNLFQIRFIWNHLVTLGQADHQLKFPIASDLIRAFWGLKRAVSGEPLSGYLADLYWVSARAINVPEGDVHPITEFPYWSFLYADLHPHVIALPFTLCLVALLGAWIRTTGFLAKAGLVVLIGFLLGFFWPTNTWDWPTYGALTGLTIFLVRWSRSETQTLGTFVRTVLTSLIVFGVMLGIGYVAFLPFQRNYVAGYGAFAKWIGERTTLRDYLFIYGLFLFVLGSAFVARLRGRKPEFVRMLRAWLKWLRRLLTPKRRRRLRRFLASHPVSALSTLALGLVLGGSLVAACVWRTLPPVLIFGLVTSGAFAWSWRREPMRALHAVMGCLAFGLSLFVEFVVLVGDIGRMNTVFKFYYQVWVMFALASALALPAVASVWHAWPRRIRSVWMLLFASLLAASFLYPVTGTPKKVEDRFVQTAPTLDGLAFAEKAVYLQPAGTGMPGRQFPLAPDLHAIRWLQDNITGSPVLLEMNTGTLLYTWGNRISIHTGLPSVVGWSWHQRQQQAGIVDNRVDARIAEVQAIYRTPDPQLARALMNRYGVRLVVVGELERLFGTPEGIEKFAHMGLEKIYDQENVAIYRVP